MLEGLKDFFDVSTFLLIVLWGVFVILRPYEIAGFFPEEFTSVFLGQYRVLGFSSGSGIFWLTFGSACGSLASRLFQPVEDLLVEWMDKRSLSSSGKAYLERHGVESFRERD